MATNVTALVAQNFIPELWADLVQKATRKNLVMAQRVFDVSGFGPISAKGDTLHIPMLSNYSATAKTAGTELPSSATTESVVDLGINAHYGIRIPVEDIVKAQASYDLSRMYTEGIGYGLAKVLDTDLATLWSGLSQTLGAAATDTTLPVSDTLVAAAVRRLNSADAPSTDRSMVLDAYGLEDLQLVDKYTRYDALGTGKAINDGMPAQGRIYGLDVFMSNNIVTSSVVGGQISRGLVFHKEAFIYAQQMDKKMEVWRNAPQLADEIIGQTLYGVKEYRDAFGVSLSYGQS